MTDHDERRLARQYVLLHPDDCDPPHGLDLEPGSRDSLKVEGLTEAFARDGFDPTMPALVGYPSTAAYSLQVAPIGMKQRSEPVFGFP